MRLAIIIATAVGSLLVGTAPSNAAAANPWCLKSVTDDVAVDLCDYRTFEQCARDRIIHGSMSFCFRNASSVLGAENENQSRKPRRKADQ